MADQIVSWGGIDSKGTAGMGVTGSFQVSSSANSFFVGGGNVGIGTPTPSASLHISGSSGSVLLEVDSNSSQNILYVSGSGNVGIGTSAPTYNLEVSSTTVTSLGITSGANTIAQIDFRNRGYALPRWTIRAGGVADGSSGNLTFQRLASTFPFTITSGDNILVGVGTDIGARLGVKGSGTTSSTTALLVQNANASASLAVLDNGNIGIGTTAPDVPLHVSSSSTILGRFQNNATAAVVQVSAVYENKFRAGFNSDNSEFWYDGGYATTYIDNNYPNTGDSGNQYGDIRFRRKLDGTNLSTVMTIRGNNGNVGIGTTSPAAKLHISGSSGSVLLEIDSPAVNNILYVSGSGNVGIGTGNPTYALELSGSSGNQGVIRSRRLIAYGGTANDPPITTESTIAGLFEAGYAQLGFSAYGGEAGRIEGASRLWNIGMTGGTAKMNIRGTGATSSTTALLIQNSSTTTTFTVRDDGLVIIPGTTYLQGLTQIGSVQFYPVLDGGYTTSSTARALRVDTTFNNTVSSTYAYQFGAFSLETGTASNINGTSIFTTLAPTSGSKTFTALNVGNTINATGTYSGIVRGIYYNPTLTSMTGVTHRAIETTSGNVIFNGGNVGIGTSTPSASLHVSGAILNYPITLPTASGTASMDCSQSNFFNLTLSGSYTLFLSASNIQPGQTVNLRVTQPATSGSLNYGSQFKFAGGIPYSASATGSAVDIISFISFDTTTLYGSAIKNLS